MSAAFPPLPYTPIEAVDHVSRANGRSYRILIAPALGEPRPPGRPLLVVLDGNAYTSLLSLNARVRGLVAAEIDEPHVVGIGYPSDDLEDWLTRRNRDLTPTVPIEPQHPDDDVSPHLWGDGDAFLSTVVDEVLPLVTSRLHVDPGRTALFGHSYGGLATLHAMFTRPDAFASFLSISPSIWWNDGAVIEREADVFLRGLPERRRPARLFMAVGELEARPPKRPPPWPYATPEWLAEHKRMTRMVDRLQGLGRQLRAGASASALQVETLVMPGETHASAPFAALTPALDFAFPIADP